MRTDIKLTDEEIEAAFSALGYGVTIDDVVLTRETLDNFATAVAGYASHGRVESRKAGGHPALVVERAQARKGQPRNDLVVIDFGAVRAAIH